MKRVIILSLLLLNILIIYSIPRPRKNKEVGAIVGRVSLKGDFSWDITLYIKSENTGKDHIIKPKKKNKKFYHLLNLEPGDYILYKIGLSKSSTNYYSWASGLELKDKSIKISVEANKTTPVNYLEVYVQTAGRYKIKYGFTIDNIDNNKYLNELKSYFEEKDKGRFWKDFEWSELRSINKLITYK